MGNPTKLSSLSPTLKYEDGRIRQSRIDRTSTTLSEETLAAFNRSVMIHEDVVEKVSKGLMKVEDTHLTVKKGRGPGKKTLRIATGMRFGDLIIRRKAAPNKKAPKPFLRERWRCECMKPGCGNVIIVPKYYLVRKGNPKTDCGCREETLKTRYQREFRIYHMMHQRCMNPKHNSFKHYAKHGITIYEPWQKTNDDGFEKWFAEVGPAPTKQHSLDRIRNMEGYFPGNLRWATAEEQRANQGDRIGGLTSEEIADMGMTPDEYVEKLLKGELND